MAKTSGKTESFTPEQRLEIDKVLRILTNQIAVTINTEGERILLMDTRPRQTFTPEQPDVFMPYVKQGMLEDLIVDLQERV